MARHHKRARLSRYEEIVRVFTRHGLGSLLVAFGLEKVVPFGAGLGRRLRAPPGTQAVQLRLALEDLGPAFVKIGQILSTRADLLPPEMLAELARLQDSARPVETAAIVARIESELGRPVHELFAWFDETPLAAASIGQVHAARLPGGEEVVVKVRRPDIEQIVEQDLEVLLNLAALASRHWEQARDYDLVSIAQEFAMTLRAELDYVREAHNIQRFAANFAHRPGVHIPRVYPELSTARVLTLERVRGVKLTELGLEFGTEDRSELAARAAGIAVQMALEDGFFHADPHPGNLFFEPEGRFGLVDFGMVGAIDSGTRAELARGLVAAARQDADRLVDVFLDLGLVRGNFDRPRLRADLQDLMARQSARRKEELSVSELVAELQALIRRNHLQLSGNLAMMLKTLAMAEGVGRQIDPAFNLFEVLAPHAHRLMLRELSPSLWARRFGQMAGEATRLGAELPLQLHRILSETEAGALQVGTRLEGLAPQVRRLETAANRVVLAVLVAGLCVSLTVMIALGVPPAARAWTGAAFVAGLCWLLVLSLWLAVAVVRSERRKSRAP